jgi:hypothetical protein
MSEIGKTHIVIMWTVGPDDVAEGDRLFESHGKWMTGHSRTGDAALRSYSISKGPELSNPLDPDSSPTGNTIFVLARASLIGALGPRFARCIAERSSRPSGSFIASQ